ncbi:MAG: hypothetical protein PF508_11790 [Spirochaeta sp.]|jgi:hypothetical protein|nr:hypothetical protein [Spirochaeta sp.]
MQPVSKPARDLLQPRRARFIDAELEATYRHNRLGDHLQQLRVFMLIGVVATVYFIPSDILFFGWGERAKWLLLVRDAYILISVACLIYSFRLTAEHLATVAILWFIVTMLS